MLVWLGRRRAILSSLSCPGLILAASAGAAEAAVDNAPAVSPPNVALVYAVIAIVLCGSLVAFAATKATLANSSWSLADALSEETDVTFSEKEGGVSTPKFDDNMKPIMVTELCASSSRLIAFIGLITILMMFMGFGVFILYFFAMGAGVPPGLDQVFKVLLAGMTMFAPYIVNKFASVFNWIAPDRTQ